MSREIVSICCLVAAAALALAGEARRDLTPRVYTSLPFDLSKIEGVERAKLQKEAKVLLSKNGFVVVGPSHGSMPDCYRVGGDMPAFVTVDSVIEVFLSDFEDAWCRVEKVQGERFAALQASLWDALDRRWGGIREAAHPAAVRLLGLVAVGRLLGDPDWQVPHGLPARGDPKAFRETCAAELAAVMRGEGVSRSLLWGRCIDWSAGRALTRDDFRKLMDSDDAPPAPEWTRSYRLEGGRGDTAAH